MGNMTYEEAISLASGAWSESPWDEAPLQVVTRRGLRIPKGGKQDGRGVRPPHETTVPRPNLYPGHFAK